MRGWVEVQQRSWGSRDQGRHIKNLRCTAEVVPGESRESDFSHSVRARRYTLTKTQAKTESERATVRSCLWRAVGFFLFFHEVHTVWSLEPPRPAVRMQAGIRRSGENRLKKYASRVTVAGRPFAAQNIYRLGRGKGKNYPVNQSGLPGTWLAAGEGMGGVAEVVGGGGQGGGVTALHRRAGCCSAAEWDCGVGVGSLQKYARRSEEPWKKWSWRKSSE